jgi:two-component system nitrogen regulation response regulator NtrX
VADRRGLVALADNGTLFLDELSSLPLEGQAKLLRVLETGEFERVGGSEPIRVDVRTLAATHRDLRVEAAAGRFREDLFFRLHVIPIHLPPLRERTEDIAPLVAHFLARHRTRTALRPPRLTPAALDALTRHAWPGNVRELANIVERVVILHAGAEVGAAEIRALLASSPSTGAIEAESGSLTDRLDAHERTLIRDALREAGGSVAEAARRLQTDRANLYRRMRRLGLDR